MIASFKQVTKHYSSGDGVEALSFSLGRGEIIGLLGLNGAGKTTTMKLMAGMLHPESGSIDVMGKSPKAGRHHVAFLGDRQSFPSWMAPRDMHKFMAAFYSDFQPDKFYLLLEELDVPHKRLDQMSKGQRQKLKIVATMARKADLYLLDEPLSGIDLVARTGILKTLIQYWDENTCVLISTHEIKDIDPFLDRAIFIGSDGCIKADETTEAMREQGLGVADRFLQVLGGQAA
ncbi:ABC-2 type transport system ATP-binding protein [Alteromonadaceae bacterium Bs31]|nr:ABC-2 type transport system ATP-binding protein [Alteromonadaceae bacterium Bs31]